MKKSNGIIIWLLTLVMILSAVPTASAQERTKSLSEEDYAQAEKFLRQHTDSLVFGATVSPDWMGENLFWYRNNIPEGYEYVLVDMKKKKRSQAFDHQKLAQALSSTVGETYEPYKLPFQRIEFSKDRKSLLFFLESQTYSYNIAKNTCAEIKTVKKESPDRNLMVSPDGKRAVFIREYNLWMRDMENGKEIQLTKDGQKDFGYGTNNAGWTKSDTPVLLWSPDSKKIATFQHDGRGVGEMYLVNTKVGHPKLEAWKYPLPEDKEIFRIHRIVIHVDEPRVVRFQMPPDQHRSTITDHIAVRGGELADAEWSQDSLQLAFVSVSRDHKHVTLRIADPETGKIRDVLEEKVDTFFESGFNTVNWHVLSESNEVIWFSQRDDWGHLYLYDLATGKLKHQITQGSWNVLQVLRIDRKDRLIYFLGCGREEGDPYFQYFYRAGMDGKGDIKLLTPESANHRISLSPTGENFVDSYSTPVKPPVTLVRNSTGQKLVDLEKADISRLTEIGWQPPVPFSVKARDGKTELYGLMHKPTPFDPGKKYPIINSIYPGPQTGSV
ncbi:MAG: DPP IV N-terminal domain-containing protein, partial [Candidatus Aminicenantes bacterium]|nr:DPP IV N-terminal domain-containing protein [Candidatus Aminicenantes bacterium]